jgi:hypothetical protein
MRTTWPVLALVFALSCNAAAQSNVPPSRVKVLPVFFVPSGEAQPSSGQVANLMRHISLAQQRYRELLRGRTTFELASQSPMIHNGQKNTAFYRAQPEGGAPHYVAELLAATQTNRINCPYVFLMVYMSPSNDFPPGGARPINGGYGTGGGIVILSSFGLDRSSHFQSTLQHEIGHSFGLPHVDVYGYSMSTSMSIMSYNTTHWTNGFTPSPTPGVLIPEDLRGLASNKLVFPQLEMLCSDIPTGYRIASQVNLGPMTIPGHPPYVPPPSTLQNFALRRPARQSSTSAYSRANDAQGGNDGIKNGSYGFHTDRQNGPWWEVDLCLPRVIQEVRIFNRMDYNPERAYRLLVRLSDDGQAYRTVYTANGNHFGGIRDNKPLRVLLPNTTSRFVRIGLPEVNWLHLDEIEVYGN